MRYRKKPVVIDAWRFDGRFGSDMPEWVAAVGQDRAGEDGLFIRTLEGVMRANVGDWIIRGVKGEVYPCKPDIFEATYEAASP